MGEIKNADYIRVLRFLVPPFPSCKRLTMITDIVFFMATRCVEWPLIDGERKDHSWLSGLYKILDGEGLE